MGLCEERLQRDVLRTFGPSARLDGSIGFVGRPGRLTIIIGDRTIGSGASFQAALSAASRTLSAADGRAVRS